MHDVLLADGDAPRREEQIDPLRVRHDFARRLLHVVWQDAENDGFESKFLQPCGDEEKIAVVDFPGAQRLTGRQEFVARTRHSDARTAIYRRLRMPLAREHREIRRAERLPLPNNVRARADILARIAVVLMCAQGERHEDCIPVLRYILLPDHAVTARRNRAARHDADGLARTDRTHIEIARALLADHTQAHGALRRRPRDARRSKGIAVERRTVERRIGDRRIDVLRRRAPCSLHERHALYGRCFHIREQYLNGVLEF